jgi:pSer/pThr/pTyr-binding forkhead associated (FHA) protein
LTAATLRVGTLEITAALVAAALLTIRPRPRVTGDVAAFVPLRVDVRIERPGRPPRTATVHVPAVIGRSRECDVVIDDDDVSRRHAALEVEDGVVYLRDLRSTNGTFLNGERVRGGIEILPGDAIDLGGVRMYVVRIARSD